MNTIKIYDGPSQLDGARVIVLMTGLKKSSKNTKTGDMLQTWVMRYDVAPNEAQKTGDDASVCGRCPLRPLLHKAKPVEAKPCYVKTFQAPRSTWKANRDLPVTPLGAVPGMVAGRRVRRGSYGDPAAVPAYVWASVDPFKGTGYTHQWREHALGSRVMASVHTQAERLEAKGRGYRTFRIISDVSELERGEVLCPASKEAGARTTCERCNLCDGRKGDNDKRRDVAIVAH